MGFTSIASSKLRSDFFFRRFSRKLFASVCFTPALVARNPQKYPAGSVLYNIGPFSSSIPNRIIPKWNFLHGFERDRRDSYSNQEVSFLLLECKLEKYQQYDDRLHPRVYRNRICISTRLLHIEHVELATENQLKRNLSMNFEGTFNTYQPFQSSNIPQLK